MPHGYLALVLHAHLPFVRHPEAPSYMEEEWFFEAITETYAPLLLAFERLGRDDIDFRLTLSFSPSLLSMMTDELLKERYGKKLDQLIELAEKEVDRTGREDRTFHELAKMYRHRFLEIRDCWRRYDGDLVRGFRALQDAGRLEVITCTATHPFFPLLDRNWAAFRAQIHTAADLYERLFGRRSQGMWLGECGYVPGVDELMREEGIRFFFVDTHGVLNARPRPPYGVYGPIASPSGVAFFGRDAESSKQVWSRDEGYPGDAFYRDFYRDIGFDLPVSQLRGEVAGDGSRLMTGLKYFRITGKDVEKQAYQPGVAAEKAKEHAADFVFNRAAQVKHLASTMPVPPIVVAPYDAELYGHWWFEGPMFLEAVFRRMHEAGGDLEAITLREYLVRHPVCAEATPSASSWGAGGYGEVWVGPEAAPTWRHVHHATRYAKRLVDDHRGAEGLRGEALDQVIRELLLLQSSDWPFILKTGTATRYAEARIRSHVHRLRHLGHLVETGRIEGEDVAWLDDVRARDNFLAAMHGDELRAPFET